MPRYPPHWLAAKPSTFSPLPSGMGSRNGLRAYFKEEDDRRRGLRETTILWFPFLTGIQVTAARGSYAGHTQSVRERTGTYEVHGFDSGVFFDGLFLAVFSEVLAVSSRISSFPQFLGLSESPPGWHSLDGNLPIWAVRGCPRAGSPWMESFPSSCWLFHSESGSSGTSLFRRPPGQPFLLDFVVYASCSLTSSGALGRMPWGTQGLFWDTLNKGFSFRKEVRSWSRSC